MSILAIPANGPELDARASVSLPHAPYLVFVDGDTVTGLENPAATATAHRGVVVAKALLKRGVTAVLGHHMGHHPLEALQRAGVAIHEGSDDLTVRELVVRYEQGTLPELSAEEVTKRHDTQRGHGHGGGCGCGHG